MHSIREECSIFGSHEVTMVIALPYGDWCKFEALPAYSALINALRAIESPDKQNEPKVHPYLLAEHPFELSLESWNHPFLLVQKKSHAEDIRSKIHPLRFLLWLCKRKSGVSNDSQV